MKRKREVLEEEKDEVREDREEEEDIKKKNKIEQEWNKKKDIILQEKPLWLPNIVILCRISRLSNPNYEFPLTYISHLTDGKYSNGTFPAVVIKCIRSFITMCFFSSGNLIGTGCSTEVNGLYGAQLLLYCLSKGLHINDLYITEFKIPNTVANLSFGSWIDIEGLRKKYALSGNNQVILESSFPGLSMKRKKFKCCYIFFENGKVNATGLKKVTMLYLDQIDRDIRNMLSEFKINDLYSFIVMKYSS